MKVINLIICLMNLNRKNRSKQQLSNQIAQKKYKPMNKNYRINKTNVKNKFQKFKLNLSNL